MRPDKSLRLYQVWRGNNRFFCGGRLIFGPDVGSLFLSTFLIVVPAFAFFGETAIIISHKIKQDKDVGPWYTILGIGIALTVLDMIFFFLTSSRDPGIIPRNATPPDCDDTFDMNTPSMEWVNGRTPHLKIPRVKDVIVNGHAVKVKYCDTCLIYRPPRASHCSICNNCVQRFDHHCPWLGQCIGIHNYRFFYMFITNSTILCLYVFVFSWINIVHRHGNLLKAMKEEVLADILIIYCFISVWFVGGLSVFHLYLILTNQTTYENFRYRYDKKDNPYNRGKLQNFKEVFFSKIPSSLNDFRSFVEEEDECVRTEPPCQFMRNISSAKEKIDINTEEAHISLPELLRNLPTDDTENDDHLKSGEGSERFDINLALLPTNQGGRDEMTTNTKQTTASLEGCCSISTTMIDANLATMSVEEGQILPVPETSRRPSNTTEMEDEDQGDGLGTLKSNTLGGLQEPEIKSTDNGTDTETSTCKLIRSNSERAVT
ncbi:protein modifying enzyme [Lithospermum erythrorhizon]|uniref:S-acyltransferase n=1 Tax=Lithospermum erythrorhizon TaxID=34254 RepID=A0AAV3Q2H3_LITER